MCGKSGRSGKIIKKPLKYYSKYVTVISSNDSDYNSYILMAAWQSFRHSDSLLTNPFKISREAEMFSCVHRKEVLYGRKQEKHFTGGL